MYRMLGLTRFKVKGQIRSFVESTHDPHCTHPLQLFQFMEAAKKSRNHDEVCGVGRQTDS